MADIRERESPRAVFHCNRVDQERSLIVPVATTSLSAPVNVLEDCPADQADGTAISGVGDAPISAVSSASLIIAMSTGTAGLDTPGQTARMSERNPPVELLVPVEAARSSVRRCRK